jgi:hypothetical protein
LSGVAIAEVVQKIKSLVLSLAPEHDLFGREI